MFGELETGGQISEHPGRLEGHVAGLHHSPPGHAILGQEVNRTMKNDKFIFLNNKKH